MNPIIIELKRGKWQIVWITIITLVFFTWFYHLSPTKYTSEATVQTAFVNDWLPGGVPTVIRHVDLTPQDAQRGCEIKMVQLIASEDDKYILTVNRLKKLRDELLRLDKSADAWIFIARIDLSLERSRNAIISSKPTLPKENLFSQPWFRVFVYSITGLVIGWFWVFRKWVAYGGWEK